MNYDNFEYEKYNITNNQKAAVSLIFFMEEMIIIIN